MVKQCAVTKSLKSAGAKKERFRKESTSLCADCMKPINARLIERKNSVYLIKDCPKHGKSEILFENDSSYHRLKSEYDKPGTITPTQTKSKVGCPFDCGLCDKHEQHSCIALIEITDACNLSCPTCYAVAGSSKKSFLDVKTYEKMLDFFIKTEGGRAEILQISGGEPTVHPDVLKIIELTRSKNIGYILLNTNGLRIAEDVDFVKQLSKFQGGFEIYLQFDSFDDLVVEKLRGKRLLDIKLRAITNLQKYKIPITLVSTVEKGLNDKEIGKLTKYALETSGIRGINFQPKARFGRGNFKDKLTISEIREMIDKQTNELISISDIIPLPCNVWRVALTYAFRTDSGLVTINDKVDIRKNLNSVANTFAFDLQTLSTCSCCKLSGLMDLVPLTFPVWSKEKQRAYISEKIFRLSITSFIDAFDFDEQSARKECVHVITPDLKRIPFSAYNIHHRQFRGPLGMVRK